jgi:hypothetical protein
MDRFLEAIRAFGAAPDMSNPCDREDMGIIRGEVRSLGELRASRSRAKPPDWEDKDARRARKRAEGLKQRELVRHGQATGSGSAHDADEAQLLLDLS